MSTLTKIPRMPDYLSGVINLLGNVVPVTDLGLKLRMAPIEKTQNTCIMIVEVEVEGVEVEMGVLTDSVQMVLDLPPEAVAPVPKMGTDLNTDFIKGMGRQEEKFLIILDSIPFWRRKARRLCGMRRRQTLSPRKILCQAPRLRHNRRATGNPPPANPSSTASEGGTRRRPPSCPPPSSSTRV